MIKRKYIIILCFGLFIFIFINSIMIIQPFYNSPDLYDDGGECFMEHESFVYPADIHTIQHWTSDDGHTLKLDIDDLPEDNKIEIKMNGEVIDTHDSVKEDIEYNAENNDSFVITQYSANNVSRELTSITMNEM